MHSRFNTVKTNTSRWSE